MRYFFSSVAICMLFVLGVTMLRPDGITMPSNRSAVEAATTNTHAGTWASCSKVSDECGDMHTWQEWSDVDRTATASVLSCARLHPGPGGRVRYEMDGWQGPASHTEIAVWFRLAHAGQVAFAQDCAK